MSSYQDLLNSGKTYLGKLCKKNHEFNGSGMTLRYKVKWQCVECKKEADRNYREANRESCLEKKRKYFQENKEHCYKYRAEYRKRNKEKVEQYYRDYAQREYVIESRKQSRQKWKDNNQEKIKAYNDVYRKRVQPRKNIQTQNYRARKRSLCIAPLSKDDMNIIFEAFDNKCAYCDKELKGKGVKQLDHFYPLNKGGFHCKSNLVPACISCNSGKQDLDPVEWYQSSKNYNPSKLKKILKFLGKDESNYNQLSFF